MFLLYWVAVNGNDTVTRVAICNCCSPFGRQYEHVPDEKLTLWKVLPATVSARFAAFSIGFSIAVLKTQGIGGGPNQPQDS